MQQHALVMCRAEVPSDDPKLCVALDECARSLEHSNVIQVNWVQSAKRNQYKWCPARASNTLETGA